jgi:FtsP/CotA-like multicopper oxidase with cupredoxin domain
MAWKEFHLVAEPVVREIAPGMKANLWGYNGQSPGADHRGGRGRPHPHLRHQQAARGHLGPLAWHPACPIGMDGVTGTDAARYPGRGKTFLYEFVLQRSGTFMYHPHADEMTQMAMGMMGFFIVHPKDPSSSVDRDYVFMLNAYDIDPGSAHAEGEHHARLQSVDFQQPRFPRYRFHRRAQG